MNLIQKKILDNKLIAFEFKWMTFILVLFLFSIVYGLFGGPGSAFLIMFSLLNFFSSIIVHWICNFIRDIYGIKYDSD